jgi:hypothetical protein
MLIHKQKDAMLTVEEPTRLVVRDGRPKPWPYPKMAEEFLSFCGKKLKLVHGYRKKARNVRKELASSGHPDEGWAKN